MQGLLVEGLRSLGRRLRIGPRRCQPLANVTAKAPTGRQHLLTGPLQHQESGQPLVGGVRQDAVQLRQAV
eukprot:9499895-Lingulodinium_polyedra.AAC.1